ncbi:MAG: DUF4105 domain-containing protein [Flavobacteriaceae bacterium]|nr:DUF4105 domain-containing protein [Flavobacteriaceae bacterium]
MRIALLFLLIIVSPSQTFSQPGSLSQQAEISILTVGPGKMLNDAFGHNGIRINDPGRNLDIVFNYGVYDFNAPNFYLKFAQGKLNYMIGANRYPDFYQLYTYQNRTIQEQVLNLSPEEKQNLYNFLLNNYEPENRYYLYDFFYDNCATKMRDVLEANVKQVIFKVPENLEQKTFRELIHEHVGRNSWGSFGIDLALGSVIDRNATPDQYMFLPKYIYEFFEVAERSDGTNIARDNRLVFEARPEKTGLGLVFSPLVILSILSLIVIYLTIKDWKSVNRRKWIDGTIFTITGFAGVVLLLLWFATDHTATANNYNLLWAFPLNLIFLRLILKSEPPSWFRRYIKFLLILLALMVFHWISGVQIYSIALIPILVMLTIRYIYLIRFFRKDVELPIEGSIA